MQSLDNPLRKESLIVSSDHHQIFLEDTNAETTDEDYPVDDMMNLGYCLFGETLAVSTEDYGNIRVTFQNYEPEKRFLYRGSVLLKSKSKSLSISGPTLDQEENILEVSETDVPLHIYANRKECASEIVFVTDLNFKVISEEEPPQYLSTLPEDWEEDGYFATKIELSGWNGFSLPTYIDHPCEGTILAGDSNYVKNTGCQNIDDELIFYYPAYSEVVGVRMHLLDVSNPIKDEFIASGNLVLLEKKNLPCPSGVFLVSDFLGYQPYFSLSLRSTTCKLSIYVNHDYNEPDGSASVFLFVVEE
jgi:hypothetical protein